MTQILRSKWDLEGKRSRDDPGPEKPVASLRQIWTDCFDLPPSTPQATKYFVFSILLRWIALTCLQASNALNPATPIPQEQTKKLPLVKIGDRQTDRHPDPKIGPQTPGSVKNIIRKSWMKRRRGGIQAGISRICLKNIINIIEKYYKNIIKISQGRGGEGHTVWYQQPQSESGSGGHNGCGGHLQYFGGHNTLDTKLLWTQ